MERAHTMVLVELADCDLWAWRLEDAFGGLTAKGYQPSKRAAYDVADEYAREGALRVHPTVSVLSGSGRDW